MIPRTGEIHGQGAIGNGSRFLANDGCADISAFLCRDPGPTHQLLLDVVATGAVCSWDLVTATSYENSCNSWIVNFMLTHADWRISSAGGLALLSAQE